MKTPTQPLRGLKVLVTRARKQAPSLSALLREQGASVQQIPCIEVLPPRSWKSLDTALRNLGHYDWLILTSVNGVEKLFSRMKRFHMPIGKLGTLQITAIGPATKAAIEQYGLAVQVTPKEYIAEAVVRSLRHRVKGKRVLLVRAAVARDVIPNQLRQVGAEIDVVEAYRTEVPKRSQAKLQALLRDSQRRPNIITFTSSSTVRNFFGLLNVRHKEQLDGIALASIGPVTSSTLKECGLRVDVQARNYTMKGLTQAIVSWSTSRS